VTYWNHYFRVSLLILFFCLTTLISAYDIYQFVEEDSLQIRIEHLKNEIQKDTENASLRNQIGYLYLEAEEWHHATSAFKKCIAISDTFAQAYNGLGMAYHERGESAFIPVEKIKRLFKIDNYSLAEKKFERALELRPGYLDPLYNIGKNYLAKTGLNNYEKAVDSLIRTLEFDSTYKDADYVLGIAYQHVRDFENAERVLLSAINANRWVGKANMRLSDIYLEIEKYEEATQSYYEGLLTIDDPKLFADIYAELNVLMTFDQRKKYKSLADDEKGEFIRKFWKKKDPTPTTETNERFVEHFKRKRFALVNFPDIISPYYDDRGKVYVKYGQPDARHIGKLSMEGIKENESWAYEESIQKGLTFDFVKKGHSYREVNDLSEAAPPGVDISSIEGVRSRLYEERFGFTESYDRFSLVGPEGINQTMLAEFQANRIVANREAPAESFVHELSGNKLSFVYNLAQFRTPDKNTRTEVYLGIPNNNLNFISGDNGLMTTLDLSVVALDTNYMELYNRKKTISLFANNQDEIANQLFIHQEDVILQPGNHILALRIENPQGNSRNVYQNALTVTDFRDIHLKLSDIQLASHIQVSEEKSGFTKKDLSVVPYPYTVIRRKKPIYIYFEVYNLTFNIGGVTEYTVDYSVELLEKKRGFLSKTIGSLFRKRQKVRIATSYNHSGSQSMNAEYFSIDMGKLSNGLAQLTIKVTDNVSGENDTRQVSFQLID
jgi:GWxTD domain-containing protein